MRVQIQDRDALSGLPLPNLRAYLRSRGWSETGRWGQRPAAVYAKEHNGRIWEITVPYQDTIGGYAEGMAEAVSVLAEVEDRSQLDVLLDLRGASADAIRVRPANRGREHAPAPLPQSAGMLQSACRMLEAAARSAEKPQAAHRGEPSSNVAEYLESVRPMHGYPGSHSLTLHSPAPASLEDSLHIPFPRRATAKLTGGLRRASAAVEMRRVSAVMEPAPAGDALDHFRRAVDSGVSANLCDAVADLAERGGGIIIEVVWASIHPSGEPNSRFQFSAASVDILAEAAGALRRSEPAYGEHITGQVIKLEGEPREFDNHVTIMAVWDGRLTRMSVRFEQPVYNMALRAFRDQITVSLEGDIHPAGRGWELRNPRNLSLHPEG